MANLEHLRIVTQGAEAIAKWRDENPEVRLDLGEANLWTADLRAADLSAAKDPQDRT